MKQICAALLMAGALVVPLQAELKYTMKIEARPSTVAAPASTNPLMAMIGPAIVGMMAPAGGLELTVTVGERGTRVDYARGYTMVPAGGATIVRPDGSMLVIDPAAKTYWQLARPDLTAMSALKPTVTVKRTGEMATVAGTRAERATMEVRLPMPAGVTMPQGMPAEMVMTGDVWLSAQYAKYAKMSTGLMGGSAMGFDAMAAEGFMVRSIMRGEMLGGQEIEAIVTNLTEAPVPASLFEAPAGFTEVPPPAGMPVPAAPAAAR